MSGITLRLTALRVIWKSEIGEIRCFSETWVAVSWRILATVMHFELEQNVDFEPKFRIFLGHGQPLGAMKLLRFKFVWRFGDTNREH